MSSRTADRRPVVGPSSPMSHRGAAAYPLSWLLALATVAAGLPTVVLPDLLRGPAAMTGRPAAPHWSWWLLRCRC